MILQHPAADNTLASPPAQSIKVSNKWVAHALTFLVVFGPRLIVMEADNDAGALSTYVLLPICYFVGEMVVRLGIAASDVRTAGISGSAIGRSHPFVTSVSQSRGRRNDDLK